MNKGIIFDKDGTLIQLDSVWYKVVHRVLDDIFQMYPNEKSKRNEFLKIIGMSDDDFESTSLLACQTNYFIAAAWFSLLENQNVDKESFIHEACVLFKKHSTADDLVFTEVKGAKETLKYLKDHEYVIGVVTADDVDAAIHSLKMTGLYDYVDFLGADDGVNKPKPDSDFYYMFKEKFSLNEENILMVGDTLTDIKFARNSNIKVVGVLSGASSKEDLEGEADYILDSMKDISKIL
ncbi:hydrolase [Bacillus sp. AFS018417]|uniref:HAD family hydrolase n=1 Tax=unclassified Bacillus (in: firmicutes) TaxID=185979 RepID=UPI000BF2CF99|nr:MULTISPECIES: HAD family hydrolase [unclassified Bacillus (in: firmicutes)]MCP1122335.1 HAD family hydrolase [Bacillus sp. 3103sda1]PEZ06380.1 hydrolase [Bacillus sp. AFS018417]